MRRSWTDRTSCEKREQMLNNTNYCSILIRTWRATTPASSVSKTARLLLGFYFSDRSSSGSPAVWTLLGISLPSTGHIFLHFHTKLCVTQELYCKAAFVILSLFSLSDQNGFNIHFNTKIWQLLIQDLFSVQYLWFGTHHHHFFQREWSSSICTLVFTDGTEYLTTHSTL